MNQYLLIFFAWQTINCASDLQWNIPWSWGIIGMWRKTLFGIVGPYTSIRYLLSLHMGNSTLYWYSYLYQIKSFLREYIFLYSIPNSTNNWCASLQVDGNTFSSGNILVFSALQDWQRLNQLNVWLMMNMFDMPIYIRNFYIQYMVLKSA